MLTLTANKYFETRFAYTPERSRFWSVLCRHLQRYVPENGRVLDLGAGYCDFINNIHAAEKFALDRDESCLENAKSGIRKYVQSCTSLQNFGPGFFDVVFASNLLEHLTFEEIEKTLDEVYRVLKLGGLFILISPNFRYAYKEYFDDYTHKVMLTHIGLSDLLASHNLQVKECIPRFLPFSIKSGLPANPFLVQLYLASPIKPFAKQMLIVAMKVEFR